MGGGHTCLGSQGQWRYLRGGDSAGQSELLSCRVRTGRVESAARRDRAWTARSSEGPRLICAPDGGVREVSGEGAQAEGRGADGRAGTRPFSGSPEGAERGGAAGAGWQLHPAPEVY